MDDTIRELHALLATGAPKVRERPPSGSPARKVMEVMFAIYWKDRDGLGLTREAFIEAAWDLVERDLAIIKTWGTPGEDGFSFNFKLRTPKQRRRIARRARRH